MTRLKDCICGQQPNQPEPDGNNRYWFVRCSCGRATVHSRTREEAVEAWNGETIG